MTRQTATRWVSFAVPCLLLVGCSSGSGEGLDANGRPLGEGDNAPPPALDASFESLQANVFTPLCTACHAGAAAPVGLKLDAGNRSAKPSNCWAGAASLRASSSAPGSSP